mmetsp:Transcript_12508/g.37600  ORF Transcript_12508/g.37600 Transcript_12508/m.37600 type:complete len:267 (+) Transcript_12508:963-1763(+)
MLPRGLLLRMLSTAPDWDTRVWKPTLGRKTNLSPGGKSQANSVGSCAALSASGVLAARDLASSLLRRSCMGLWMLRSTARSMPRSSFMRALPSRHTMATSVLSTVTDTRESVQQRLPVSGMRMRPVAKGFGGCFSSLSSSDSVAWRMPTSTPTIWVCRSAAARLSLCSRPGFFRSPGRDPTVFLRGGVAPTRPGAVMCVRFAVGGATSSTRVAQKARRWNDIMCRCALSADMPENSLRLRSGYGNLGICLNAVVHSKIQPTSLTSM